MRKTTHSNRRDFIKTSTAVTVGLTAMSVLANTASAMYNADDNINIIGPKPGFSPHVGTLLSMMTWMRTVVIEPVKNMTVNQLDYLHDEKANTIGAMLLH